MYLDNVEESRLLRKDYRWVLRELKGTFNVIHFLKSGELAPQNWVWESSERRRFIAGIRNWK